MNKIRFIINPIRQIKWWIFLAYPWIISAANIQSLDECLARLDHYHTGILQADLKIKSAQATEKKSAFLRWPNLTLSASQSLQDSPFEETSSTSMGTNAWTSSNVSLQSSIPLYSGGSIRASQEQAHLQTQSSKISKRQQQLNARLQVIELYYNYLMAHQSTEIQQAQQQASKARLQQLEQQVWVGLSSQTELQLSRAQLANSNASLLKSSHQEQQLLRELRSLLQLSDQDTLNPLLPDSSAIATNRDLTMQSFEKLIQNNPETQLGELSMKENLVQIQNARAGLFPSISLNASAGTGLSHPGSSWNSQLQNSYTHRLSLSLNFSIFDRFATRTEILQAQLSKEEQQLQNRDTHQTLRQFYQQLQQQIIAEKTLLDSYTDLKEARTSLWKNAQKEMEIGTISLADYLEVESEYIQSQHQWWNSLLNFMMLTETLQEYQHD